MKIVIDKEVELVNLNRMLANLTDDKDKQSVRFAINLISGFEESPRGGRMTNEQAKWELEHIYGMVAPDVQRALDLALKALEYVEQISRMCGADKGEEECTVT